MGVKMEVHGTRTGSGGIKHEQGVSIAMSPRARVTKTYLESDERQSHCILDMNTPCSILLLIVTPDSYYPPMWDIKFVLCLLALPGPQDHGSFFNLSVA